MMKCPACGLSARDGEGDADGRKQVPPIGVLVLCECGAVNRAESSGDIFADMNGARKLVTLTATEFDALPALNRRALENGIEAFKRKGRYRAAEADPSELVECASCGHERRQHLDPRWPCSMLACPCPGFR